VRPHIRHALLVVNVILNPHQNHLLAALPDTDWQRWLPHLELIELPLGQVLYESGDVLSHAYFPIDAIVSLLYVLGVENRLAPWWAMRGSSASHSSWRASRPQAGRSSRMPDTAFV
jgi:hypothetical protein